MKSPNQSDRYGERGLIMTKYARQSKKFVLVVVVFLAKLWMGNSSYATHYPNLLSNPGFEEAMSGWRRNFATSGAVHSIDRSTSYSGHASLRFEGTDHEHRGVLVQTIEVVPEKKYKVAFAQKLENVSSQGIGSAIRLQFFNQNGEHTAKHAHIGSGSGTHDWDWVEAEIVLPPNTVRILFEIFMSHAVGVAWWDDVYFAPLE